MRDPATPPPGPEVPEELLEPFRGRTALVTGGLGFVGSNLVQALARGGARVRVLDALLPPYGGNWFNLAGVEDRVSVLVADVRDRRAVTAAVDGADVVFHVAAQTSHVDSMEDPFTDADMNVRGTLVVLEALRRHAPGARLIHLGTRAQHGAVGRDVPGEDGPFRPVDVYGATKHAAEQLCLVYHRAWGLDTRSLRATNTYGPRHQVRHGKYGILNWFVRLALEDRELPVFGDGAQLRDFLYVDDLVAALLAFAAAPGLAGRALPAGSGVGIPFREMAEAIVRTAGRGRVVPRPWPADRKRIETGDFVFDPAPLREATGWEPRVPFQEGLARTVAWYRTWGDRYW